MLKSFELKPAIRLSFFEFADDMFLLHFAMIVVTEGLVSSSGTLFLPNSSYLKAENLVTRLQT